MQIPENLLFSLDAFSFAKEWIPKLLERLQAIRASREQELSRLAEQFGDPLQLAQTYIQSDCQQLNPADFTEDEVVVREPLFNRLEAFFSGSQGRKNNQLFLLSDAGMGKTSALLMLKLAHLTSFWPHRINCILEKIGPETISVVGEVPDKGNTILLLDALDEDPLAWGAPLKRIGEILAATKSFRRVVISCRTQFFTGRHDPFNRRGQVEVAGFVCPTIFASLWTDAQAMEYILKIFPKEVHDLKWLTRTGDIIRGMGFLRMRPMLMAHLEDILESNQTVWNEYSIYKALIDAWLLREQRKLGNTSPSFLKDVKKLCRYTALQLHLNERTYFTRVETEALDKLAVQTMNDKSFSISGRSLLNKDSEGSYRFSHSSIGEFLVLEYLIANQKNEDLMKIRITGFMHRMAIAWLAQAPREIRKNRRLWFLDISGLNIGNTNLSEADLSGVSMKNADFTGTDLTGANLSKCDMTGAIFQRAVLVDTNLCQAKAVRTNFIEANLQGANFQEAHIMEANFMEATIINTNFQLAYFDDETKCNDNINMHDMGARIFVSPRPLSVYKDPNA